MLLLLYDTLLGHFVSPVYTQKPPQNSGVRFQDDLLQHVCNLFQEHGIQAKRFEESM